MKGFFKVRNAAHEALRHKRFLAYVVAGALSIPVCLEAQPVITVRDTLFHLGDVYRDQKISRSLAIKNSGNANLHIDAVTSPCGCTTTQISKYDISPGDSAQVSFTLNSSILLGEVRKYFIIVSNDLLHRNVFIHYDVNVINVLTSKPSLLYLGDIPLHTDASGEILLVNTSGRALHILKVTSLSGKLTFSHLPPLIAAGDSAKLTVGLNLGLPVTFKDEARIETDNDVQPTVRISVVARGKEGK